MSTHASVRSRPRAARISMLGGLVLLGSLVAVVPLPQSLTPRADALADLAVTQSVPGDTLIGSETPVRVTATNNGDTTAYNLALSVTVPTGVSVSSADQPVNRSFPVGPTASPTGTVYVWENVVDIKASSFFTFRYSLQHDTAVWDINDTFDVAVNAYVSDDDNLIPGVDPDGADPQAPVVTDASNSSGDSGATTLVPVLMTKSEPSPEGELLRGVHDHQTVYTLSVKTGDTSAVHVDTVEDWFPAGLEFLGCGDVDNSSGEEYPGSGSLVQGTTTGATPCPTPQSVETVSTDPDGSGPLSTGVYTHVVWELDVDLAANATQSIAYVAGIPQRENVLAFPGLTPLPGSLRQAANLDNNTGGLTTQVNDGITYRNHAEAQTTFGGVPSTVDADASVQAVDLAVQKLVDTPTIAQGGVSTWTLQFRSSEYVVPSGITGLTVEDTTPDGTCPIDTVSHGGAGCTGLVTPGPNPAYLSYDYDPATGHTALSWDLTTRTFGPNETGQISFSTVALQQYHDGQNVEANDRWVNSTDFAATAETFEENGPTGDTDTNPVTDDSSREQSGTSVQFTKDVAVPSAGQACGNGSALTWEPDLVNGVGPGDRVCFRLTAIAPDYLNTGDVSLVDFLPVGFSYETSVAGPDNEVPNVLANESDTGDPETGVRVEYGLLANVDLQPAETAQVILSAVLDADTAPDVGTNDTELTNNARYSFQNSSGEVFVVPDSAGVGFEEAHVTLTKGISKVNATTYDPPIDPARDIVGNDVISYAITVTNTGDRAAQDVDVWDLLPRGVGTPAPDDALCADIDPDVDLNGTCSDGDGRIEWTVPSLAPTGTAGASVTIRYTWTVPDPVDVGVQWSNHAGVVQYASGDNNGAPFVYVPRNNIDITGHSSGTWNTDRADDTANVFTPGITLTKTRTTDVSEAGNSGPDQATIGEVIHYTLETRQSDGTTVAAYSLEDSLVGTGQTIVTGSVLFNSREVDAGDTACSYDDPAAPAADNGADNEITLTSALPDPSAGNDLCLLVTFDAVVNDAPVGGEPLNRRPNSVTNSAELDYTVDGATRTAQASVSTQIVEPDITIDKRSTNTSTVLPGSDVTYQLVVTNTSGTAVSAAKDVVVTDDYSGVPVSGAGDQGIVANPDNGDVGGGSISWSTAEVPALASLAPGQSITLTYTIRLSRPLDAGDTFTNAAVVTTTSLAGASPDQRTAGAACSPATCPGYIADDDVPLTVAGPTLVKDTSTPLVTVGSIATYTTRATLPANLNFGAVQLVDNLAGGATTFHDTVSVDCANCTAAVETAVQTPEENGTATTATPRWDLGTFSDVPYARVFVITYNVRVENQGPTTPQDGGALTNTATLSYATTPGDTHSDDAEIAIAEPDVAITKRVQTDIDPLLATTTDSTPKQGRVGGTVGYRLTLTNNSSWPAYDVPVVDEPDTQETNGCGDTPRLAVGTVTSGAGYTVTDGTLGANNGCLGFAVPVILPGGTVTIDYSLDVSGQFDYPADFHEDGDPGDPELVNEARVGTSYGLDSTERATIAGETGTPAGFVRAYDDVAPVNGYVDLAGGRLGDRVWYDLDGDGTQDAGEPGIADIGITVIWGGPDGDLSTTGDNQTYDRTTNSTGLWYAGDPDGGPPVDPTTLLPAGEYRVRVSPASVTALNDAGLTNTGDPDGGGDSTALTTLDENETDLGQDFGYAGTGSLGDRVWLDLTRDGVQDAGEPGIVGTEVSLVWSGLDGLLATTGDNVSYGTVSTGTNGAYTFDHLPAGNFRVTVDPTTPGSLPAGVSPSYDLDDGTDEPDGVAVRNLTAGQDATDVDFGYSGTGRLGDTVWFDTNANGTQGPAEPGIAGVQLTVVWSGFDGDLATTGDNVTVTRSTNADGKYAVNGVPAGDVRVTVVGASLPGDLTATYDLDGTAPPTPDGVVVRNLGAGEEKLDVDFGYRGDQEIGDFIWLDVDGDGTPDAGEPGIQGQRIRAVWAGRDNDLATDADNVTLAESATTDADGIWHVEGVPTGTVRAALVGNPATTLRVSYDNEGAKDGVGIDTVADGVDNETYDFGLAGTGSLGDDVWLDFDTDGVVDPGEPKIPDVQVEVTWAGFDDDFATTTDNVTYPAVTTNAQGKYGVENLPPGRYRATVLVGTLPGGVVPAYDLDAISTPNTALRVLAQGENALDDDFGYAGTGRIGDFVWWDLNGDGVQDPTDPGLADVTVTLDWAGFDGTFGNADDGRLVKATDVDGGYLFTGLPEGAYRVTISEADLPAGVTSTADPDGGADSVSALTLAGGASNLDQDFGYVGASEIGDLVWRDVNRDGTRQDDEPALKGVMVTVRYLGPDGVAGTDDDVTIQQVTGNPPTTEPRARGGVPVGGDPFYLVEGLAPGKYVVTLDAGTVKAPDAPISDLDGGDPTVTSLTLTDDPRRDADFAVFQNEEPSFDGGGAAGAGIEVECDGSVVIDPFAFVTDANGDRLTIVKGSIKVPADVVATRTDSGKLKVSTTGDDDFVVRYQVADGRGGVVTVRVPIEVATSCADGSGGGDGGLQLPGTGSDVPGWLLGLAIGLLAGGAGLVVVGVRRRGRA